MKSELFYILCAVTFLVRLHEKFEIDQFSFPSLPFSSRPTFPSAPGSVLGSPRMQQ